MKNSFFVIATMLLIWTTSSMPQTIGFGSGPFHVAPAYSVSKGQFYLSGHSRAFFKDEVKKNLEGIAVGETYWDIQGALGAYYGLSSKLELALMQVFYQDTHKGESGYNLPDNLYFRAKLGSFGSSKSNIRLGAQLDIRLPIAEHHNIPLEPYSAGRIGVGITGLFSIISEPLFPQYGINIHANLGYFDHHDLGVRLTDVESDTITANKSSKEFLYGLAFSKSINEFGIFAELYGSTFLEKPPVTAFTREDRLYFAPGISYSPNPGLRFKVAFDLRIVGGNDKTVYNVNGLQLLNLPWENVPNLPSWRINVGATLALNTLAKTTPEAKDSPGEQTNEPALNKKVYEQLTDEKREAEEAEEELERIRRERRRMEELLDRLRNILEYPAESQDQSSDANDQDSKPE